MWTTTARGALEDNDIFGKAFSAVKIKTERGARRSKRWEPIPPLAVGVISEVEATMPPGLPEPSNFQDDDGTEGWIT
jgi:hypothetical protein